MIFDHEKRRKTIGASEIAAILGLNPWMTPLEVWLVKTGREPPFEGNEHTKRGQRQERQILECLAEDLGRGIATDCPSITHSSGLASATPDGLVLLKDDKNAFVEGFDWADSEYSAQFLFESFRNGRTNFGLELAEGKSTLKTIADVATDCPHFWLQCQWQLMVTGLEKCHLAIFGPMVSNYQRFEIDYNEDFMLNKILPEATEWWEKHVVGDLQPDPVNESDANRLWQYDDGTSIVAVDALADEIAKHTDLKDQIKDLTGGLQPLRDSITRAIGSAQKVVYNGRVICTYKTDSKGSRRFQTF